MPEGLKSVVNSEPAAALRVVEVQPVAVAEMGDEALMQEHGRGSEEAFVELVRRHQKGIQNYAYRMVQNRQIAEELTQEVFLALVKNAHRYQPTAKFTTYLYTIASNMISKEWLRRKRRPKFFSLFSGTRDRDNGDFHPLESIRDLRGDVAAAFERGEISDAVNDALRHLPEHQREAFVLKRFRDLSYDEVAGITKVPVGTAKSRVVRAEKALRPLLASYREYLA